MKGPQAGGALTAAFLQPGWCPSLVGRSTRMKRAFSADIEDASEADEDVTVPLPKGRGENATGVGPSP